MKRITKLRIFALYLFIIIALSIGMNFNLSEYEGSANDNNQIRERLNLKGKGYWNLTGTPILIDDLDPTKDWAYTALIYDWCSGAGTLANPYVIENVTIDGQYADNGGME